MTSSARRTRLQPVGHRLPRVTAVVLLLFVCIGLTGHDPWKADEAYTYGIVYSMIASGDWVVPTLADEAFVEKPPIVYMLMLVMSSSARANYLLPVLPALATLAAPAATMLPRSINRIGTAATLSVFVAVALFVWIVWAIAVSQGNPPDWPLLTKHLPRDQPFVWATYPFVLATLLTSLLVAIVVVHRRTPSRLLTSWCAGILLFGVAASQLWMPWIDAAKSYREPFTQMRAHLPYDQYCLSRHAVGESERGLLHYFLGAIPTRYQANAEAMCPFVLVQGFQNDASALHAFHNPRVLWRGARRGDQREQFWLLDLRNEAEASVPLKDMAMGGAEEAIAKRQLALALFARRLPVVENDRAQKY
jgi:hypothetical protein